MKTLQIAICSKCEKAITTQQVTNILPVDAQNRRLAYRCLNCQTNGTVSMTMPEFRKVIDFINEGRDRPPEGPRIDTSLVNLFKFELEGIEGLEDVKLYWNSVPAPTFRACPCDRCASDPTYFGEANWQVHD